MKITILIIFLFFGNFNLIGQPEKETINKIERENKVYQETEKDYQRFIKKQARLRKKLDKHIQPQDLEKLEIIRTAYYNIIIEDRKKAALIPKLRPEINTEAFVESWTRMNDRFSYQIRAHDILNPMLLGNKRQYEIAEYLVEKYDKQIEPVKKKIEKAYLKLKKKWSKAREKNSEGKQKIKQEKKSKKQKITAPKTVRKISNQPKVFNYTKILIIKSEV